MVGLLKKKSKDVELYRYWNAATRMIKVKDLIELNSCWQAEEIHSRQLRVAMWILHL